jgi:phosphatidylglycerophosphate synthase
MNNKINWRKVKESQDITKSGYCYIGKYLYLPISWFLAPLLIHLNITANHLTVSRFLISTIGAILIVLDANISVGIILIIVAYVFDVTDGSIARVTNSSSHLGKYIDSIADIYIDFIVFPSIAILYFNTVLDIVWIYSALFYVLLTAFKFIIFYRFSLQKMILNSDNTNLQDDRYRPNKFVLFFDCFGSYNACSLWMDVSHLLLIFLLFLDNFQMYLYGVLLLSIVVSVGGIFARFNRAYRVLNISKLSKSSHVLR